MNNKQWHKHEDGVWHKKTGVRPQPKTMAEAGWEQIKGVAWVESKDEDELGRTSLACNSLTPARGRELS